MNISIVIPVFEVRNTKYMLYNGNDYIRLGIGLIILD